LALLCVLAIACGDDDGETPTDAGPLDASVEADAMEVDAGPTGPIELVLDLGGDADFWDWPFPIDSRRNEDGSNDASDFPNPRGLRVLDSAIELINEGDGFAPLSAIYFRFTGLVDASSVSDDPADSRDDPDAPIFLVDVDSESPAQGQRVPVLVSVTERSDSYRPANVLQIIPAPGFNLREETLYAVVVRGLDSAEEGRPLQQTEALGQLLEGTAPEGALGERTNEVFAPLREYLGEEGIDPSTIQAATVYRTGNVTDVLYGIADWAREQPAPEPEGELERIIEMPEYCAYSGTWSAPQFQEGETPFEREGGRMVLDDEGHPVEQRREDVPFVLAVPKGEMPAEGWPLLFYVNGTGGISTQVIDRGRSTGAGGPPPGTGPAQIAARRGWGSTGVAGIMTPERLSSGGIGGYIFYNFLNPVAMRDNFRQALVEHILFRKLVEAVRIDVSDCEGVDVSAGGEDAAFYDPETKVVMGQSLGSYLSGMLATIDPGYDGAILTGAGGSWTEFAFGARSPDLTALARLALSLRPSDPFDFWHPGLVGFDWSVAPSDNTHYVDEILRDPTREGRRSEYEPPHVLVIEGDDDDNISTGLQRALLAALGVDLVDEDVGAPEDRVLPWIELSGFGIAESPVSENVTTPAGVRTGAVVRWLPDFDDGGHYVTFQLEGPKHQYGCFLETLLEGAPVVVEGGNIDDPCE